QVKIDKTTLIGQGMRSPNGGGVAGSCLVRYLSTDPGVVTPRRHAIPSDAAPYLGNSVWGEDLNQIKYNFFPHLRYTKTDLFIMDREQANVTIKDSNFNVNVKEIGTWSTLNSNDMDSNESDDDHDMEEHRSTNEDEDKPSEEDVSDTSKPPGFENFIMENSECSISSNASRLGKCSTSFGNYKRKELKGFSFIDEMSRMIEVGGTLRYDVNGCKKSLRKMINGIGKRKNYVEDFYIINVYGPQHQPDKFTLWSFLHDFILSHPGKVILFGDLNEVRNDSKRFSSIFPSGNAAIFNDFIQESGLIDLHMGGRSFTWMNKFGSKMSKHDWFLISDNVNHDIPTLQVVALDKRLSNHNPILLH
nr:RNA-directed DNA polymerase, eukaryota [Tanacetum cinerariifolium]